MIMRINFYSDGLLLVQAGHSDDDIVEKFTGRKEIFEIKKDERLYGCALHHGDYDGKNRFLGVTWWKCPVSK
jgi:hypothetical protein